MSKKKKASGGTKKKSAKKRASNPAGHHTAPKKKGKKKRASNPAGHHAASSGHRPKKRKKGHGVKRHRNPSLPMELIAIAAGLGAGVVMVLASAVLAPTNQNFEYGITAAGIAAGIGLALAVNPVIGTAVAVGSAAPALVQKAAAWLYSMITPKAPPAGADAAKMGAMRNPYGMNAPRNPFGMRAVVTANSRYLAAKAAGMGAIATGTRAQAAAATGMGASRNPFGMGAPHAAWGASDVFSS